MCCPASPWGIAVMGMAEGVRALLDSRRWLCTNLDYAGRSSQTRIFACRSKHATCFSERLRRPPLIPKRVVVCDRLAEYPGQEAVGLSGDFFPCRNRA